jgi:hypothetical protein
MLDIARKSIVSNMLTGQAQILTKTVSYSDLNDEIEDWDPTDTIYPCRVTLQSDRQIGDEQDYGDADSISGQVDYIIKLPWDCPLTRLNRLRVNGIDYEVKATNGNHTDRLLLNAVCTILS